MKKQIIKYIVVGIIVLLVVSSFICNIFSINKINSLEEREDKIIKVLDDLESDINYIYSISGTVDEYFYNHR